MDKTQNEVKELLYGKCSLSLLLFKLKNNIYLFTRKKLAETLINNEVNLENLTQDLNSLKKLFITLSNGNEGRNPLYIENLSKTWDVFKKICIPIKSNETRNSSLESKILFLLESIENFHKDDDLSFGYYLTEHNEQDLAPFPLPFMETLEALHKDHQILQNKSTLSFWITTIEDLLEELSF